MAIVWSLLLLLTANGAPVIARHMASGNVARPLDAGIRLADGEPLFGETKTWRGLGAAIGACLIVGWGLGFQWQVSAMFAVYAMLGDLFSSFIKRRMHIPSSGRATGLDQIPESLFPLILLRQELGLSLVEVLLVTAAFFVLERLLSRLLYRWHIRNRPY